MANAINYREELLKELTDIPEEFIPSLLDQVKVFKVALKGRMNNKKSPTRRLMKLAGSLENPDGLTAREYKQKAVDDFLSDFK